MLPKLELAEVFNMGQINSELLMVTLKNGVQFIILFTVVGQFPQEVLMDIVKRFTKAGLLSYLCQGVAEL